MSKAVQVDLPERGEGEQLLRCGLEQFGGFDVGDVVLGHGIFPYVSGFLNARGRPGRRITVQGNGQHGRRSRMERAGR